MHPTRSTVALSATLLLAFGCNTPEDYREATAFDSAERQGEHLQDTATERRARPSIRSKRVLTDAPKPTPRTDTALDVLGIDDDIIEDVIEDELFGPKVTVSNIQFTGASSAIGTFEYDGDELGLNSGIIMSTGAAASAMGNNASSQTTTLHYTAGDSDLNALGGTISFDAAAIEFDFSTSSDELVAFEFILASEEYLEFSGSMFADGFAVFISEVGTDADPDIDEAPQNIAQMEHIDTIDCDLSDDAIGITTITPYLNPCLYIDNDQYTNNDELVDAYDNFNGDDTEYDGFTRPMRLNIPVQPHANYRIKIVIADAVDAMFDTAVFIKTGSFQGVKTLPREPLVDAPYATKLR